MHASSISTRPRAALVAFFLAAALIATAVAGGGQAPAATSNATGIDRAIAVQDRHTASLLGKRGVVGTAVGESETGEVAVKVYTAGPGASSRVPGSLGGVPVDIEVTGQITALHHRAGHDGGPSGGGDDGGSTDPNSSLTPTDRWPRPVPIGISTGNVGECSAGTIGARVKDASGNVYALSNNHVYAAENEASIGSKVLQPGRYDTGCSWSESDVLGTLSAFEPLKFGGANNTMDAAIASTTTANLGTATPADGYGVPSSSTVPASLRLSVQKYGRTTALTQGIVTGINGTVNVGYSSGTARFVDQVFIESQKGPIIKSGDSGSLAVTRSGNNPVGLMFAGDASGKFAVANEIDTVLARFGVSVDGG